MESLNKVLSKHNITLKKAFGQNFLTDKVLLDEIVEKAGVGRNDYVLEIGCGAGALTSALCQKAGKVFGYEIDTSLKPVLTEALEPYDNAEITFSDIMKNKISDVERKIGKEYILVANLPYYITTPIIMNFLENAKNVKAMVIMVQEEVALRLAASAGSSDYGAITVGINLRGKAQIVMRVPRCKFTPPPNVDSAVVRIDVEKDKFKGTDLLSVRETVKCAFSSRRKMLVNNLMNYYKLSRSETESILSEADIPLTVRGESLTAENYVELAKALNKRVNA